MTRTAHRAQCRVEPPGPLRREHVDPGGEAIAVMLPGVIDEDLDRHAGGQGELRLIQHAIGTHRIRIGTVTTDTHGPLRAGSTSAGSVERRTMQPPYDESPVTSVLSTKAVMRTVSAPALAASKHMITPKKPATLFRNFIGVLPSSIHHGPGAPAHDAHCCARVGRHDAAQHTHGLLAGMCLHTRPPTNSWRIPGTRTPVSLQA